jgi:hypothetical protein
MSSITDGRHVGFAAGRATAHAYDMGQGPIRRQRSSGCFTRFADCLAARYPSVCARWIGSMRPLKSQGRTATAPSTRQSINASVR